MVKNEVLYSIYGTKSDDPNATEKLAEKIDRLEKRQTLMREFNKALRKNDTETMLNLGFSEANIRELTQPNRFGGWGFRHEETYRRDVCSWLGCPERSDTSNYQTKERVDHVRKINIPSRLCSGFWSICHLCFQTYQALPFERRLTK